MSSPTASLQHVQVASNHDHDQNGPTHNVHEVSTIQPVTSWFCNTKKHIAFIVISICIVSLFRFGGSLSEISSVNVYVHLPSSSSPVSSFLMAICMVPTKSIPTGHTYNAPMDGTLIDIQLNKPDGGVTCNEGPCIFELCTGDYGMFVHFVSVCAQNNTL